MNRVSMNSTQPTGAKSFSVARDKEASDRGQVFGRGAIECDPEKGVVVSPPGRAEKRRVECLFRPGDMTTAGENPARW
jgi:hypothetical protein